MERVEVISMTCYIMSKLKITLEIDQALDKVREWFKKSNDNWEEEYLKREYWKMDYITRKQNS